MPLSNPCTIFSPIIISPGLSWVFLAIILLATSLGGQEQACRPIALPDGAEMRDYVDETWVPQETPYHVKLRMLVSMYGVFRHELAQQLSPQDDAILSTIAAENDAWVAEENARYHRELLNLCSKRSELEPAALYEEDQRLDLEAAARHEKRYLEAVGLLSSAGQEHVKTFIEKNLSSGTSYTRPPHDFDPDLFMQSFEIKCYIAINGEPPPEVKRMLERLRD